MKEDAKNFLKKMKKIEIEIICEIVENEEKEHKSFHSRWINIFQRFKEG